MEVGELMANRLLRDGICTSDPINALSAEEEVLFYRLLVVSDDYGHMDGRTPILKAQCFPLKETATVARIETWVDGLVRKTMLARYKIAGGLYLAVCRWESRIRTKAKYPMPTAESWFDSPHIGADGELLPQFAADGSQGAAHAGPRNAGRGLGLGLGLGASNDNEVVFDAATGHFAVPELLNAQWAKAYPAISVDVELSKASAWLIANPKNAKSNYARFLTNWLTKAQDKAPRATTKPENAFAGGV